MTIENGDRASASGSAPLTLAIDVGGTGLKASVLDSTGKMLVKRVHMATPDPCRPEILLDAIQDLTAPLPGFDRISVGFPGVIRAGRVITAPHFDTDAWRDYPLEAAMSGRFGKPARLLNDAEIQGLGIVARRGLEVVLTLGTGVGCAVFQDGHLTPHLELAQHPIRKGQTYNDYIGNKAFHAHSGKKWNQRVLKTIDIVRSLLHYDTLYLGGGNAANIVASLPENVHLASNETGITGGIHLWDDVVWDVARGKRDHSERSTSTISEPASSALRQQSQSTSSHANGVPTP